METSNIPSSAGHKQARPNNHTALINAGRIRDQPVRSTQTRDSSATNKVLETRRRKRPIAISHLVEYFVCVDGF